MYIILVSLNFYGILFNFSCFSLLNICTAKIDDIDCNHAAFTSITHDDQHHHKIFDKLIDVTELFNYASTECGSEVVASNNYAENIGGILEEDDPDEYLRTPCGSKKFVTIQLCEESVPVFIELANYEFFSSSVKDFKVLISTKNPTRDWINIGKFTAENNRDIQRFKFEAHNYSANFLRIEWLSHYGNEYYCTLSTVKVYGIEPETNRTNVMKKGKVIKRKKNEDSFGPIGDL